MTFLLALSFYCLMPTVILFDFSNLKILSLYPVIFFSYFGVVHQNVSRFWNLLSNWLMGFLSLIPLIFMLFIAIAHWYWCKPEGNHLFLPLLLVFVYLNAATWVAVFCPQFKVSLFWVHPTFVVKTGFLCDQERDYLGTTWYIRHLNPSRWQNCCNGWVGSQVVITSW